jgi:sigma-B regulation protein RsbU (phosphoserine phosphatase)
MALCRTLIRTYAIEHHPQPEIVLSATNHRLLTDISTDMFVTVFYGILDPITGEFTYCNAGHNPPYLLNNSGELAHALGRTGIVLGIDENRTWTRQSVHISVGDILVLYTDGITESQNTQELFFGNQRLLEKVKANRGRSAREIQNAIIAEVNDFASGAPQFDDIALIVIVRGV